MVGLVLRKMKRKLVNPQKFVFSSGEGSPLHLTSVYQQLQVTDFKGKADERNVFSKNMKRLKICKFFSIFVSRPQYLAGVEWLANHMKYGGTSS